MKKLEIIQTLDMIDNMLKYEFQNYGLSEQSHLTVWQESDLTDSAARHNLHIIRNWLEKIQNAIEEENIYE
jgi:queuine/archaeosine tRNA-ribosyltransferase